MLAASLVATAVRSEQATEDQLAVVVAYIDVHTGPSRHYPVTFSLLKGERLRVQFQRTGWLKIVDSNGREGWILRSRLFDSLGRDGEPLQASPQRDGPWFERRWQLGVLGGDFNGADYVAAMFSAHWHRNIGVELLLGQATGQFSDSFVADLRVSHQAFPDWIVSPYVFIGTGYIDTTPKTTLVQVEDRSDQTMSAGAGLKYDLGKGFLLRLEYDNRLVLTSRNNNETVEAWSLGFNVYF